MISPGAALGMLARSGRPAGINVVEIIEPEDVDVRRPARKEAQAVIQSLPPGPVIHKQTREAARRLRQIERKKT